MRFFKVAALAFGASLAAAGAGHSLVPLVDSNQTTSLDHGAAWRASAYRSGSPGVADPAPVRDVVFSAGAVPGFGWATFRAVEGQGPATAVRATDHTLANEHVTVEVAPTTGSLTITADGVRVSGADRLVDGGDGGDTYNYSPPDVDFM